MADEIVVMRGGEIMQIGSPDQVYDMPANVFVADFIGAPPINLLRAKIDGTEGVPAVRFGGTLLPLLPDLPARLGQDVVYGVRPTDVAVDPEGPIAGSVLLAETTGTETLLHVDLEHHELRVVVPGRRRLAPGEAVRLSIDPARVHVFDAATEKRIG